MVSNAMIFIIGLLSSMTMTKVFYKMLKNAGCTEKNYRNEDIPIGMGLALIIIQTAIVFIYSVILKIPERIFLSYIVCILLIGLVGFVDDIIGEKTIKGFKGHIYSIFKGKLTTGFLKAIGGLMCAIIFSAITSNKISDFIVNIFIISLFTNLLNLFDLRPGRSLKVFILVSIILLFASVNNKFDYIIYSLLGITIAYLPLDIKGKSMLGDTGSNMLGITLGIYCSFTQTFYIKIIFLISLILLNGISEIYSFSRIINKIKVLKFLDNLGRY